jgi:hypothetical protein
MSNVVFELTDRSLVLRDLLIIRVDLRVILFFALQEIRFSRWIG